MDSEPTAVSQTPRCPAGIRTAATTTAESSCPRCGGEMIFVKASWHCLGCRYKEGCC